MYKKTGIHLHTLLIYKFANGCFSAKYLHNEIWWKEEKYADHYANI